MYILMLVLAICSGLFFAVQGPVNAALGKRTSVFQGSLISFFGGTVISAILMLIIGNGDLSRISSTQVWQIIGGLYGVINVGMIIVAIPLLGAALTLTVIMLGQLSAGVVIDHFGLFGSKATVISGFRVAGILTITAGIILIYIGSLDKVMGRLHVGPDGKPAEPRHKGTYRIIMLFLTFVAGIFGAIQSPTNASLAGVVGNWEGTFISFVVGTIALIPITLIANKGKFVSIRKNDIKPWMLLGGIYGVGGIFLSLLTVVTLGTAMQVACGMIGQLSGGMIIDTFGLISAPKVPVNKKRLTGIFIILAGVVIVTIGR